jgi:hypothetical protein
MRKYPEIPSKYKAFLPPVAVFLVIVLLSATFARSMVSSLVSTLTRIDEAKQEKAVLETKLEKLRAVDVNVLSQQAQVSLSAIPSSNSSLSALSTIRTQAFEKNVRIIGLKVEEREASAKGAREISYKFELEGSLQDILGLLESLQKTAPLTKLTRARILSTGTGMSASLDLLSFWSQLPGSLPPANAAIENLSGAEQQLIKQIEALAVRPNQTIVPATPSGKANPFEL